jgi:hypothetical protein
MRIWFFFEYPIVKISSEAEANNKRSASKKSLATKHNTQQTQQERTSSDAYCLRCTEELT